MTARAFRIGEKGRLHEQDPAVLLRALADPSNPEPAATELWVDLTEASEADLDAWLQACAVPHVLVELMTGSVKTTIVGDQASAALVSEEGAYFFFPLYGGGAAGQPARLTGLCLPHLVLTLHDDELPALQAAQQLAQQGGLIPSANTSGVVAALLRFASNRSIDRVHTLRTSLRAVAQRVGDRDDAIELQEILDIGAEVETLSATAEEQLVTARALSFGKNDALDVVPISAHFGATVSNLETLQRNVERLDRRVDSLRDQYDSRLVERTNRRLAVLTVLSAVFMPLTLIAGIYGMNFQYVPELSLPWAYPVTLLVMVAIAGGMTWYFWTRGWFN